MRAHIRQVGRVVAVVFRNPDLRREEIAFFLFNGAEWAVWIAMLVYAYGRGGATMAGLVALIQLVPATLFAPFASVLADRYRPALVIDARLFRPGASGWARTAAVLLLDGPPWLAYARGRRGRDRGDRDPPDARSADAGALPAHRRS